MCFPTSKIPQTTANGQASYNGYIRYAEQIEMVKAMEQATRNPLSVGKERNRARK
jgi:hypothetical protein